MEDGAFRLLEEENNVISNHGIALVLEDAHTLGELFSQCVAPSHPAQLLTPYDNLRWEHAALVHFHKIIQFHAHLTKSLTSNRPACCCAPLHNV